MKHSELNENIQPFQMHLHTQPSAEELNLSIYLANSCHYSI